MSKENISTTEVAVFGLTGGMGSGKSTVAGGFAERGAVVLDADQIVKDLQVVGSPVLGEMVELLGEEILDEDGALDRYKTGQIVFHEPDKKAALETMLHPKVWGAIEHGIGSAAVGDVVVLDVPLLLDDPDKLEELKLRGIVVVDTPIELAVRRLEEHRGVSELVARQRISQQLSREERLSYADYVVVNDDTREVLEGRIEAAWQWMNEKK